MLDNHVCIRDPRVPGSEHLYELRRKEGTLYWCGAHCRYLESGDIIVVKYFDYGMWREGIACGPCFDKLAEHRPPQAMHSACVNTCNEPGEYVCEDCEEVFCAFCMAKDDKVCYGCLFERQKN